ncbi:hypothetical protein WJX84_001312 [Apatococcus fuscideae]|uniref:Uncharacterized protein n=1 Tax=Apatococcus fuscideae TaxID=2026836 RepID=A0AAW1SUK4_9CHLO
MALILWCALQGQIVTDCAVSSGALVCPSLNGTWGVCGTPTSADQLLLPAGAATPASAADMQVALRRTTSGEACRLPFIFQGMLLTDCIPVDGTGYACQPHGLSAWKPCAPVNQSTNAMHGLQHALQDHSLMDGLPGSLCMYGSPAMGPNGQPMCQSGSLCIPIPESTLLNQRQPDSICKVGGQAAEASEGI